MAEPGRTGEGLVAAHRAALQHTGSLVRGVPADAWDAPTPCAAWSARQLLDHVIGGNLWVPELIAGRTIAEVGDRLDRDHVGDQPVTSYGLSATAADAGFSLPGALSEPVAVSYGPVPGEVYLGDRCIDVLVHGWDLAAATGQDRALPPELVAVAWDVVEPHLDQLAASGAFGDDHAVEPGDDPQARLLHALGRDPDWSA